MAQLPPTLLFFIAGLVAHAGNYLTQLMLGRTLGPESFSDFSAVFSIWLLLEVLTLTVQTVAVSISAATKGSGGCSHAIRAELTKVTQVGAPVLSLLLVVVSPWLATLLKLECGPLPLVLVACCLPLSMSYAIERGTLQGQDSLGLLARSILLEVGARILSTAIVLALGAGVLGAVLAVLLSVLATHRYTVPISAPAPKQALSTKTKELLKTVALSTLAVQLLNLSDLLAIKSVLSVIDAGFFAGFFLLGKIVLLISSPLYLLLLSRPIRAQKSERNPFSDLFGLTGCALLISGLMAAIFSINPNLSLLLLGEQYRPGSESLVPIAWSAVSLVAITCCINYSIAMGYRNLAWLALLGGICQPLVICLAPKTLMAACWAVFAWRSALASVLFVGIFRSQRVRQQSGTGRRFVVL